MEPKVSRWSAKVQKTQKRHPEAAPKYIKTRKCGSFFVDAFRYSATQVYRLHLCRRPRFLHIRLYLIWVLGWFGMRHWIRAAIWLRNAYLKISFAGFWYFHVFDILWMVSGSLVLYFDTHFMHLFCFEAIEETRNEKPCNMVVEFRLDLPWGPDWWQKRCRALPIAYCQLKPGTLFSLILLIFHRF